MKTWINRDAALRSMPQQLKEVTENTSDGDDQIAQWLGKLNLLYGIPFHNLVPNSDMLPEESLRFFHIDSNWMGAIMDGALSIGRMTSTDLSTDALRLNKQKVNAAKEAASHRSMALGSENIPEPTPPMTGFLLRSALVKGWPGLEVKAYKTSSDTTPLDILRMDRLSEDVMLLLYGDTIQKLEILEPPEGLHFGADDNNGTYTRDLRSLGEGSIPIGNDLSEETYDKPVKSITGFMRQTDSRVVNVSKLVTQLRDGLEKDEELGAHFTSAEFAVEMLETAKKVVITITS